MVSTRALRNGIVDGINDKVQFEELKIFLLSLNDQVMDEVENLTTEIPLGHAQAFIKAQAMIYAALDSLAMEFAIQGEVVEGEQPELPITAQ